jgi:hypothetical protein
MVWASPTWFNMKPTLDCSCEHWNEFFKFSEMLEICRFATITYVALNVTTVILDSFTFLVIMAKKSSPVKFVQYYTPFFSKMNVIPYANYVRKEMKISAKSLSVILPIYIYIYIYIYIQGGSYICWRVHRRLRGAYEFYRRTRMSWPIMFGIKGRY